jgi:hypothetical protein
MRSPTRRFTSRDVLLLAPIEHVEAGVGQMVEAGVDFGVVVIELDPVFGEGVADALEVGMRELQVVLLVDEADDVVEDEDALHRVAHRLVLGLEPVDDDARAEVDQLVRALGFSTRSIMNSVVPRTNPAVQSGPRAVTMGRM